MMCPPQKPQEFLTWLDGVLEDVFPDCGNNSVTIHFSCLLWSFRTFAVDELVSDLVTPEAFLYWLILVFQPNDRFLQFHHL